MSKQNHNIPKDYKEAEATVEQPIVGAVVGDANPAKPAAKQKNEPVVAANGAVVSNMEGHSLSKKARVIIFGVLLLLVILSAAWLVFNSQNGTKKEGVAGIDYKKDINSQVGNLSEADLNLVASSTPDPKKDPEGAYAKALALAQKGEFTDSVAQFNAIVLVKKNQTVAIYKDFALVAASSGNLNLAIANIEAAIEAVKNDSSLDAPDKAKVNAELVDRLTLYKIELQSGGQNE